MAVNKVVMNTPNGAETLIDLTNDTIVPEAITKGVTAHDASGTEITGTFTLDDEMSEQDSLIAQIKVALQGKASGGGSTEPDYRDLYQRIEYIESTTGCKVVTDIIANNETGMELVAKYPVLADRVPMGSRNEDTSTRFYIPYPLSNQTIYHGFNSGKSNTTYPAANIIYRAALNFLNNRCAMTKEEKTNTVEYTLALTETLVQQTAPIGIFCYLRGESAVVGSSRDFIFYSARISQGNDVVREYIPCYRKSDGVIGLYEKYTGRFLINEGSGTFTKGEDVDW